MDDLDRYYTPPRIASQLLEDISISIPGTCVDSTCGEGSLLLAAQRVYAGVKCVGIDRDHTAIRRLRRLHPAWELSVADVLDPFACSRARVLSKPQVYDLVTLNPPFSMNGRRFVRAAYRGEPIQASVAMAHILRSIELFSPGQGVIAIVPESLLYSELDKIGRAKLAGLYNLDVLRGLQNSTFRGARANAVVLRLTPKEKWDEPKHPNRLCKFSGEIQIVRGGLPMFELVRTKNGLPLVHSTDLSKVLANGSVVGCTKVYPIGRGTVCGAVVLLPRVGVPASQSVGLIYLRSRIQLSDCVIALKFKSMEEAKRFLTVVQTHWPDFLNLYRGTGARYITISRLSDWLNLAK